MSEIVLRQKISRASSDWLVSTSHTYNRRTESGDDQALQAWLSIFDLKNRATARHYRTQTNKFRLFLRLLHPDWLENMHIKLASERDVALYEMALSPLPASKKLDLHVAESDLIRWGFNPDIQPFGKPLKQSSINQALSVLSSLYEFLRMPNGAMQEAYVSINPVRRVRKIQVRAVRQTDRHIPVDVVQAMNTFLHESITRAKRNGIMLDQQKYERRLWIFTLLFGLWGRREEVSRLVMGDFFLQNDEWKVKLLRKGGKTQEVPVARWVIDGLHRYRKFLGLEKSWSRQDTSPVIQRLYRTERDRDSIPVNPQLLYREVKAIAIETAEQISLGWLLEDYSDERRESLCERLIQCSPHWFRHSGPTIAINSGNMSVENASKMLGHSSLDTTTQMYHHADEKKTRDGLDLLGMQFG